eukprot:SAG22_NODE_2548_length_2457_cov_3.307040_3_plen_417_part_00
MVIWPRARPTPASQPAREDKKKMADPAAAKPPRTHSAKNRVIVKNIANNNTKLRRRASMIIEEHARLETAQAEGTEAAAAPYAVRHACAIKHAIHPGVPHHHLPKWQKKIDKFFESTQFQLVVMLLIVVDILAVSVEIVVGYGILGFTDEHQGHAIEKAMHWVSVSILLVFAVELLAMISLHRCHFFKNPWHVLDLVVVFTSLVCDLVLTSYTEGCVHAATVGGGADEGHRRFLSGSETGHDGAADACMSGTIFSLLVVLRAWRVARIFHGMVEVVHKSHSAVHKKQVMVQALIDDIVKIENDVVKTCIQEKVHPHTTKKIIARFMPDVQDVLDMFEQEHLFDSDSDGSDGSDEEEDSSLQAILADLDRMVDAANKTESELAGLQSSSELAGKEQGPSKAEGATVVDDIVEDGDRP